MSHLTPQRAQLRRMTLRAHGRGTLTAAVLVASLTGGVAASVATTAPAQAAARPDVSGSAGGSGRATAAAKAARLRSKVWRYALHQRGKPYIYGADGPHGFDCSGLVYAAYRSRGVHLPRTTGGMLDNWHLVRIRKSQARRGDLAFFGTGHVELYDKGKWTYGAQHTGTRVGFHKMNRWWHPTMYFKVRR